MICPFCKRDSRMKTPYSDDADLLTFKRRGRKCPHCNKIVETVETPTGEEYHQLKRRKLNPDQLELLADGILESRKLNHEQMQRIQRIKDELRELHNASEAR